MKVYKMFLVALLLGLFMAALYLLGAIPAWLAVAFGFVGGLLIHAILKES